MSCIGCNRSYKKVLFPLSNPDKRSRSHNDKNKVIDEQPLIVKPSENAREHIHFNNDAPEPYNKSEKGRMTIETLGLLRKELREDRIKAFRILERDYNILKLAEQSENTELAELVKQKFNIEEVKQQIEEAILPTSEFSSMAQNFLVEQSLGNP